MTHAQLWSCMGDPGGNKSSASYVLNYKWTDKRQSRPPMLMATREQDLKARLWGNMGTGESATEATYNPDYSKIEPRTCSPHFGTSLRPPVQNVTGAQDAPIYMVNIPGPPSQPDLPRYRTFGASYQSMGKGEKDRTKSRVPKSKEWGPPLPKKTASRNLIFCTSDAVGTVLSAMPSIMVELVESWFPFVSCTFSFSLPLLFP